MTKAESVLRIALTGGIASGKSAVAAEFAKLGVPVIDTDQISRDVVQAGKPTLARIVAQFGPDVLTPAGELDRRKLRDIIFSDPVKREQLNAIQHPAIRAELERRALEAGGPYQLHAIPLLVETGRASSYARVLVVDASETQQIERLQRRDGVSDADARRALAAQATRQERLAVADDVIENSGTLEQLRNRVVELDAAYRKLSGTVPAAADH